MFLSCSYYIIFFFRQMDDITLDEIDDLEENLTNERDVDEIRSMVQEPSGEKSVKPYIGMEFASQKMAYDFYNMYGYITDFSIRINSFKKTKEGLEMSIRLVCSKSGHNKRQKRQLEDDLEIIGGSN